MKERYSFIVLVIISLLLSAGTFFAGLVHSDDEGRKFCDIVSTIATKPIEKPADPVADPSRERSFVIYMKFKHLDRSLGC
jgi:hypothetical protein